MTTLRITLDDGRRAVLSTDHATLSYGVPVLLVDGAPLGAGEWLAGADGTPRRPVIQTPRRLTAEGRALLARAASAGYVVRA
jgi:hypothetical protein